MTSFLKPLVLFIAVAASTACAMARNAGTPRPSSEGAALFDNGVRGILETHCVECHGGKSKEAGFDMTTREGLLRGGDWGPGIVPGNSGKSSLMFLVRHEEEPHMPEEKPKLPDDDIARLAAWIDAGAPYTRSLDVRPHRKTP